MKTLFCIVTALALTACPTPPEDVPQSNAPGGNAGNAGNPGQGNNQQGPQGGSDPSKPPSQGGGPNAAGNNPGQNPGTKGPGGTPTQGGTPEGKALTLKYDQAPPDGQNPATQESITAGEHVTFSGTVSCEGCSQIVIMVKKPLGPNDQPSKDDLITQTVIAPGAFSIAAPKGDSPIVIELCADADNNGKPSKDEFFASLDEAGKLIPTESRSGLSFEISSNVDNAPTE